VLFFASIFQPQAPGVQFELLIDEQIDKGDVLLQSERGDDYADPAVATGSAAGQSVNTADQSDIIASSSLLTSTSSIPASCQPQTAFDVPVNTQAYVPLPQLRDHISPYTAVDRA